MARRNRMTLILEAEEFAKNKHQYQFRDNGETLYWTHLQKVVENLIELGIHDENILCAGWLHDTIEDTDTDYDDLDENFNREIADIVSTVTKDTRMIKQKREVESSKKNEMVTIPNELDYSHIKGLSNEVIERLNKHKPSTLGQASRLEGVTPAATNLIAITIKKSKQLEKA